MTRDEMMSFLESSSEDIMEKTGQVSPTFFMVDQNDEVSIIATPWGSEEEKAEILGRLRLFFQIKRAKMYGHVCEAWFRSFDEKEFLERENRLVETYEDKDECVIMLVISPDEYAGKMRKIVRSEDGASLGTEREFPGTAEGRLFNLLGTSPTRRIEWKNQKKKLN